MTRHTPIEAAVTALTKAGATIVIDSGWAGLAYSHPAIPEGTVMLLDYSIDFWSAPETREDCVSSAELEMHLEFLNEYSRGEEE